MRYIHDLATLAFRPTPELPPTTHASATKTINILCAGPSDHESDHNTRTGPMTAAATPNMSAMDPQSPFRFPLRESLQSLSPERVHNSRSRPASTISSKTTSVDSDPYVEQSSSPRSSPVRKAANLFSDYDPRRHSPVKETGFVLPASPSLPEIHSFQRTHGRTNSDVHVQGLVKRFEHLDVRDRDAESADRRKRHEAELRRAQIGREEAESDVKRLREEVRRLKKEGDEGRDRERKVAKRLDVVMVSRGGCAC